MSCIKYTWNDLQAFEYHINTLPIYFQYPLILLNNTSIFQITVKLSELTQGSLCSPELTTG
jgi:hypothetical protein